MIRNSNEHSGVSLIEHPILSHLLTQLRRKETSMSEFRRLLGEVSKLMAYEVTRDLKTARRSIETPLEKMEAAEVDERLVVASIMRAGNGMLDGVLQMLSFAQVGHIGIYRDKFIKSTVEYYFRLPSEVQGRPVLLLDPLLATGQTALAAINRLKQYEVGKISFLSVLAAPQGVETIRKEHPDVNIYCLSVEKGLDQKGYILPGLGDAGDRLYGVS
jgi:uracil phosphoribosyltransferase